jgi:Dipeptidase
MKKELGKCVCAMPDNGDCSTVIVGKNASSTGWVIFGHNEDDYNCTLQMHRVPRIKHKEGETLSFADGTAVIPQVPETYAYQWSEYRDVEGAAFADCCVNEWGVALMTDSCRPCKVSETEDVKQGMGYALRRIIPERAKTAREGVEVAIALIEEYGYRSSRTYQIVDKNEAWILHIPTGTNYVARRVGDDEVYYMANHFTTHEVDFSDTENKNWYFSKDLVEYAIRNGWYTPKETEPVDIALATSFQFVEKKDYSDFDFAAAYQEGEDKLYNVSRIVTAWTKLFGEAPETNRPFSKKVTKKYTPEDVKAVLRLHFEEAEIDYSEGYKYNPHSDREPSSVCNAMTMESFVVEFHEIPELTCTWRAVPKPCIAPYVPFYLGSTKAPKGYSWLDPVIAQRTHFHLSDEESKYDPTKAHWAFMTLLYLTEFDYAFTHKTLHKEVAEIEAKWLAERPVVIETYKALLKANPEMAEEYLTNYTGAKAQATWDWANEMIYTLGEAKILENGNSGHKPKDEDYLK